MASAEKLHLAKDAFELVTQEATLSRPENARLREALQQRYGQKLEVSAIG